MQIDDSTQDQGTVQEDQDSSLQGNQDTSGGDPLDEIQDLQVLRAEAKKFRSISQRHKTVQKPSPAPAHVPAPAPAVADVLTKGDFYLQNSNKARKMLRADPDMAAAENEIMQVFVSRRGQSDPDDIFEDMKDAFAVVKSRKTEKPSDPAAEFQTTTVQKPSSSRPVDTSERKTQRLLQKPTPMKDWFKKP